MVSRNQTVTQLAPVSRPAHTLSDLSLHDRLAGVANDLEAAIGAGDLGAIIEAARGLRRIVLEIEDGVATHG